MTVHESHGMFYLTESVRPEWQRFPIPGHMRVRGIVQDSDGDLWVLAHGPRQIRSLATLLAPLTRVFSGSHRSRAGPPDKANANTVPVVGYRRAPPGTVESYVLHLEPEVGWTTEARLAEDCSALALFHDGTLAVGGDGMLALRSSDGGWTVLDAPTRLTRVWGASSHCAYALGEIVQGRGELGNTGVEATWVSCALFYFDGESCTEVELAGRGLGGDFVDGACDAKGYGWIVGTYGTHSCMARGKGTEWEPDGCGSFYLDRVHVEKGGRAFALGGDGLWQLTNGYWVKVAAVGDRIGGAAALGSVQGEPWAVDSHDIFRCTGGEVHTVGVFLGTLWAALIPPGGWRWGDGIGAAYAISPRSEVILAEGNSVCRSPPLRQLVAANWPPIRLTPESDPQLGSSEPLLRRWSELKECRGLRMWNWWGDGIVGAIRCGEVTQLVRWPELEAQREVFCELEFTLGALSLAPRGEQVAVKPQEMDQRGFVVPARWFALVDVATGELQRIDLPPEFHFSEFGREFVWSPDGSRFVVEPEGRLPQEEKRSLLVFSAADGSCERILEVAADARPYRWDSCGVVLRFGFPGSTGPFQSVPAAWLDPDSGSLRHGDGVLDVSPSGKYRVTLHDTTIEVTTLSDGTVRCFTPSEDGAVRLLDERGKSCLQRAAWVGDRLELPAKLLGPLHLKLNTLELHYALPERLDSPDHPLWSPDGRLAMRLEVAAPGSPEYELVDGWSWGEVEE